MNLKVGDRVLYEDVVVVELVVADLAPSGGYFLGVTQRFEVATAMLVGPNSRIFRSAMHSPGWYPVARVIEVLAPEAVKVQVS